MAASILVGADDEGIRELLRLHLSAAGYEVRVAEDAIVAGYLVLKRPPDLIITDVSMPHMDGFEFIAALKADKTLPYIPVIFLTSVEEGDHRGKELGAVGYLTKPVRADHLLALVAQHVPGGAHPIGSMGRRQLASPAGLGSSRRPDMRRHNSSACFHCISVRMRSLQSASSLAEGTARKRAPLHPSRLRCHCCSRGFSPFTRSQCS